MDAQGDPGGLAARRSRWLGAAAPGLVRTGEKRTDNTSTSLPKETIPMHELMVFEIISWISLPTVMYGGYSFLSLLRKNALTAEQVALFRAGHAHAGVLLVMSLVYYIYLGKAALPSGLKYAACATLTAGILLQSGGFFWHAFLDKNDRLTGMRWTVAGAILLAGALLALAYGLIIA